MKNGSAILLAALCLLIVFPSAGSCQTKPSSIYLADLTWVEAEEAFKNFDVALIALGARTKEHGPHLPLKTDYIMAEYLRERVAAEVPVVVGICMSMNGYGFRKFYVLNTGISTLRPLKEAADELSRRGIVLRYLNLLDVDEKLPAGLLKEEGGTHADEGETSTMLYIAPETVNMSKAVKDYDARPDRKGLTRNPNGDGSYSPTGIWGDPTLATREKGKVIVETTVSEIVKQVKDLIDLKLE